MAKISDIIESFIKQSIEKTDGEVEIQRNELAIKFNCVPSQINYVIGTRFTSDTGYFVESKRGGGGHIRIRRINVSNSANYLMHIMSSIGYSISQHNCNVFINNFVDYEFINISEGELMKAATSIKALFDVPVELRDVVRARILKNMLVSKVV